MSADPFPPNSNKSRQPPPPEAEAKKVEQITTTAATRRKRPGKRLKGVFFGGDAKSALEHGFFEVLVPAAKEGFSDFVKDSLDRVIFGETRRKPSARPGAPAGYAYNTPYHRFSSPAPKVDDRVPLPNQAMSSRTRSALDFGDIILEHRIEAEEVLNSMYNMLRQFDMVTVADLYGLVGIKPNHTDYKWGWQELRGSGIVRYRGSWLLELPDPEPFD